MISLSRKRIAPDRIPLNLSGDWAMIRPATSVEHENARAATERALSAWRNGAAFAETYGIDPEQTAAPDHAGSAIGLAGLVFVAELGALCISEWSVVVEAGGPVAPVTRENIARVALDFSIYQILNSALCGPVFADEALAKKSSPSPNGAPAGADPIAGAVATPISPAAGD